MARAVLHGVGQVERSGGLLHHGLDAFFVVGVDEVVQDFPGKGGIVVSQQALYGAGDIQDLSAGVDDRDDFAGMPQQ